MELKFAVLKLFVGKTKSFNRTFMELKLPGDDSGRQDTQRFNRTFMELKFRKEGRWNTDCLWF